MYRLIRRREISQVNTPTSSTNVSIILSLCKETDILCKDVYIKDIISFLGITDEHRKNVADKIENYRWHSTWNVKPLCSIRKREIFRIWKNTEIFIHFCREEKQILVLILNVLLRHLEYDRKNNGIGI